MAKKSTQKRKSRTSYTSPDQFGRAYKSDRLLNQSPQNRDALARKWIKENCKDIGYGNLKIGGLYTFDYFEPLTRDKLDYYDAMPCTIFFGRGLNKKKEKRVIGFNWHYLPPKIRPKVIEGILEMFADSYKKQFEAQESDIKMDYSALLNTLKKYKLDFCVRMYDPRGMKHIKEIPASSWIKAAFTEGNFKKQDREAIMKHWNDF